MINFDKYIVKVMEVVPDADLLDDELWGRWLSISVLHFNDTRVFNLIIAKNKKHI